MELVEIIEVEPEASAVYYRQKYDARALFHSDVHGNIDVPIHFVVETDPLGQKTVSVKFSKRIDYPSIPLLIQLRTQILELHNNGQLY
jgi:hypothetical protein